MKKFRVNQLVMWWCDDAGWKLFRVADVQPDKIYLTDRHGNMKKVGPEWHWRFRSFGLKMLMPWKWPNRVSGGGTQQKTKRAPRWNAPRPPRGWEESTES